MKKEFAVDDRVCFVNTGDRILDGTTGTVVGHYGDFFEIVLFDEPLLGLKATVMIRSCLEHVGR